MSMMWTHLGQADGGDWTKVAIGVASALIWVIYMIATAVEKRQADARRERIQRELERGGPGSAPGTSSPPLPPRGQQRGPQRPPQRQPQRMQNVPRPKAKPVPKRVRQQPPPPPQRQPQRRRQVAASPPPVPVMATRPAVFQPAPESPIIAASVVTGSSRAQPSAVPASAVARWLSPATLRRQFILTEILQPPVALRDDHLDR